MEDNLEWKTTFDGKQPSGEDDLQMRTLFDRLQIEDNNKTLTLI